MAIDEYAALEIAHGARIVTADGIRWRGVRPFFYQPLFPFLEIVPHSKKTPPASLLGGYQHVVPRPDMANSWRHFLVWDAVRNYSIETLRRHRRNSIKKGLKFFSMKEMQDMEEFICEGHPVYLSFFERTGYAYKRERTDKKHFAAWARTLYRFPKVKILGAYCGTELAGLDISYAVEDVLIEATTFCKTEHLKNQIADFISHGLREMAAACPNIAFVFEGAVSGNRGLDQSKLQRGCKIVSKPAFYRINPFANIVLRNFMKTSHKKLIGLDLLQDAQEKPDPESADRQKDGSANA